MEMDEGKTMPGFPIVLAPLSSARLYPLPELHWPFNDTPLTAAITEYHSCYLDKDDEDRELCLSALAMDVAMAVPTSGADLALKILFAAHWVRPVDIDQHLAIDFDAFGGFTGRMLVRCAQEALEGPRPPRTGKPAQLSLVGGEA
jgi:hypothetical protein